MANPLRLVFVGPPGAGKGTQAKLLSERRSIPHISTGDMLRAAVAAGTELGTRVKTLMDTGQLVPDALIIEIIQDRVAQPDCAAGYILDGFPRTIAQAEALAAMLQKRGEALSAVLFFEVSSDDLLARLTHRRGAEARKDDSAQVQVERLRVYEQQTAPLVAHFESKGLLRRVDARGTIDQVYERMMATLTK